MSTKTVISTPSTWSSSASTRSTTTNMELDRSESSSCYFPDCRKDANCGCDMCLASINATLDLMPLTINKTSLTKLNPRRPVACPIPTPLSFDSPSIVSTPKMSIRRRHRESPTPCLKSTARVGVGSNDGTKALTAMTHKEDVRNNRRRKFFIQVLGFLLLVFGMKLGLPLVVSRALRPQLSAEVVRDVGERTLAVNDVSGKFRMLQSELQPSVDAPISNCSHNIPAWEISQDGLLLRSRCVLYKSAAEEVRVWGWPLQTAGLLASSPSLRSFTVLSGRVTQWPEGRAGGYLTIKARGSWVQDKFRTSVIQLDGQTWVLEYSRSMILENEGLFSAAWEFLKYRLSRAYVRNKSSQLSWLAAGFKGYSGVDGGLVHPT